jgi:hypothetical protein
MQFLAANKSTSSHQTLRILFMEKFILVKISAFGNDQKLADNIIFPNRLAGTCFSSVKSPGHEPDMPLATCPEE